MKKVLVLMIAVMAVLTLSACEKEDTTLNVWLFTDEIKGMIEDYYLVDNPDLPYTIEISITASADFEAKLDPVLDSKDAPDMVALEAAFVSKYVETGYLLPLDDTTDGDNIAQKAVNNGVMPYTLDIGTNADDGVVAMTWQCTPGAFFYRRSMATVTFGSDDPADVQAEVANWDKFQAAATDLKADGYNIISGYGDLTNVFYAGRTAGWQVDGALNLEDSIEDLFILANEIDPYTAQAGQWSDAWFAEMKGNATTFGYFLPTWGLHYVLVPNSRPEDSTETFATDPATSSWGDWGMVQGPQAYSWGGTWIAGLKTTDKPEACKDLIEYITINQEFQNLWVLKTGDFVSNKALVNSIKTQFSMEFLAGQNHYIMFADFAEGIDGSLMTSIDGTVQNKLANELVLYVNSDGSGDDKSYADCIADFKAEVEAALPDLTVA